VFIVFVNVHKLEGDREWARVGSRVSGGPKNADEVKKWDKTSR